MSISLLNKSHLYFKFLLVGCLTVCMSGCTYLEKVHSNLANAKKIAFICTQHAPFVEKCINGIQKHLSQNNFPHDIKEYYCTRSCDLGQLRSVIEEVLSKKYDLVCTCGTITAIMAKEISLKKNITTPIVFTAALNPIEMGLMKSKQSSGTHITGVTNTEANYETMITTLQSIKPKTNKTLIAFAHIESMIMVAEKIKIACEKTNIDCILMPVSTISELKERLGTVLDTHHPDTVITLWDTICRNITTTIAKLCALRKITLFTTHIDGIKEGAAISCAMNDEEFGIWAAKLIIKILHNRVHPSQIPLTIITDRYRPYINSTVAEKQGLELDRKRLEQIKNITII